VRACQHTAGRALQSSGRLREAEQGVRLLEPQYCALARQHPGRVAIVCDPLGCVSAFVILPGSGPWPGGAAQRLGMPVQMIAALGDINSGIDTKTLCRYSTWVVYLYELALDLAFEVP
jgi:hypothetical protein